MLSAAMLILTDACMLQQLTPSEQFRNAVLDFNEDLRWQRVDTATGFVAPSYRQRFGQAHRGWGDGLVIVDSEVQRINLGDKRDKGESTVTFSWHGKSGMVLRQTTIAQRWKKKGRDFQLIEEKVLSGDDKLLAAAN